MGFMGIDCSYGEDGLFELRSKPAFARGVMA